MAGAREFVRATRKTGPDDLLNSAIAGFGTGAILGRLQGKVLSVFLSLHVLVQVWMSISLHCYPWCFKHLSAKVA